MSTKNNWKTKSTNSFLGKRKQWPTKDENTLDEVLEKLDHLTAAVDQVLSILEEIEEQEDSTDSQDDDVVVHDLN